MVANESGVQLFPPSFECSRVIDMVPVISVIYEPDPHHMPQQHIHQHICADELPFTEETETEEEEEEVKEEEEDKMELEEDMASELSSPSIAHEPPRDESSETTGTCALPADCTSEDQPGTGTWLIDQAPDDVNAALVEEEGDGQGDGEQASTEPAPVSTLQMSEDNASMGLDPSGPLLKSALKRANLSQADRFNAKKYRVKFNEALNTFLECDYVIYIDEDDEDFELVYDFELPDSCQDQVADEDEPKLVSVRSFELQLPESCDPPQDFVDQTTLSPPDGYKDALYAMVAMETVVDDSGSDSPVESGAGSPVVEISPPFSSHPEEPIEPQTGRDPVTSDPITMEAPDPVNLETVTPEEPKKRLNGILKGGKLWKGNTAEKTGVRFFGPESSNPEDSENRMVDAEPNQDPNRVTGNQNRTSSAFQQLFPRARKMLQEVPQEESGRGGTMRVPLKMAPDQEIRVLSTGREFEDISDPRLSVPVADSVPRRPPSRTGEIRQRRLEPGATDSLIERLRWLTTDVDEPLPCELSGLRPAEADRDGREEEKETLKEVREDADGNSDTTPAPSIEERYNYLQPLPGTTGPVPLVNITAPPPPPPKTSSTKGSAYRKLNELFFKPKPKEKHSKEDLNRSFSPPPPAEVEPKMRTKSKQHVIHILPKMGNPMARLPADYLYVNPDSSFDNHSSGGDSYSLDDIDAALTIQQRTLLSDDLRDEVSGGSRSSGSSGDSGLGSHDTSMTYGDLGDLPDELAAFVQQDQRRIERIRRRYTPGSDEEAEDYGFLRRPSVRGIKPRFSSTSEILQQMQAQLVPPAMVVKSGGHVSWPYPAEQQSRANPPEGIPDKRKAVHMPVLQENVYHNQNVRVGVPHPQGLPPQQQMIQRPSGSIYGSTGELYQQLRGPRPAPQPGMRQLGPGHPLERTASAVDASFYGSMRRQQHPHLSYSMQRPGSMHLSPTRDAPDTVVVPPHPHQYPLRTSFSNPQVPNLIQQRPQANQQHPGSSYVITHDVSGAHCHAHYPNRPVPYGVPPAGMVDPRRYRQVLPNAVSMPTLRQSAIYLAKDEREGPEGASSSPGLTSDVMM